MTKEQKYYVSPVAAAIGSKAKTVGLVKDFGGSGHLEGLTLAQSDKTPEKQVWLITLSNDEGERINLATKSDNVIKQIDDICQIPGMLEDRGAWKLSFSEVTTKTGRKCISVDVC